MKYCINQIYEPSFSRKNIPLRSVSILHQQQDQHSGVEQQKAAIKKRKRKQLQRIAHNQSMTEIINIAQKNLAEGRVIKVGV
jgi:hypothetical protein